MVSQTLICFKVDSNQLEELNRICDKLGVKRNKLLNFFVVHGNMMLSDVHKLSCIAAYQKSISAFFDDNF